MNEASVSERPTRLRAKGIELAVVGIAQPIGKATMLAPSFAQSRHTAIRQRLSI